MRFLLKNSLYIIFLILISLVYFVTYTESGLQFSLDIMSPWLPGKLNITTATGKLFSKFSLQNISYTTPTANIHIKKLDFAWNPYGLLVDKLVIDNFVVDQANIKIVQSSSNTDDFNFHWLLQNVIVKKFKMNQILIQQQDAQIEFNGTLTDHWNTNWRVNIPHLNLFFPDYAGSIVSSGKISGPQLLPIINAEVHGNNLIYQHQSIKNLTGTINFNLETSQHSSLSLLASDINLQHSMPLFNAKLEGQASLNKKILSASLHLRLAQQHDVSAQLALPKFTSLLDFTQPISGHISINSSHLELLNTFIPEIKNLTGKLQGNVILSGTLNQPNVSGNITINEGYFTIPRLGINLEKINLQAESALNKQITYHGNFQVDKGSAEVNGMIDYGKLNYPISLALKGNNLKIINLSEYRITASPDLNLTYANQHLQIQGNIFIPYAEIQPKNFSKTVTLPSEVVFVNKPDKNFSLPFDTSMKISLQLGDQIHITYNDLETLLKGDLQINQLINSPLTANGELYAINGKYNAYGQELSIQEGHLIFIGGALTNPGLNIRAVKKVNTVSMGGTSNFTDKSGLHPIYLGKDTLLVGVQIAGSLNTPSISLFSTPSGLSQNDILSYLIFGYPQSQVSEQKNTVLLKALSALNLGGGKNKLASLTAGVQNTLGLNELDVESKDIFDPAKGTMSSTPSFVIGKQLTPNLVAKYSIGLFNPISIFNLHYQISKRFAIQSETSSIDKGADLLYSIERD